MVTTMGVLSTTMLTISKSHYSDFHTAFENRCNLNELFHTLPYIGHVDWFRNGIGKEH
jgi:hypothetical protein